MRLLCVAITAVAVVALAACAPTPTPAPTSTPTPEQEVVPIAVDGPMAWEQLPPIPDGPRGESSTLVWTGNEIILLGGRVDGWCPDNASCVGDPSGDATTAWAFDVATDRWRALADPPRSLLWPAAAHLDGTVYVSSMEGLLAYDIDADEWRELAKGPSGGDISVFDQTLVMCSGSDELGEMVDRSYDPATETWSDLPDDPIGPAYNRTCTATPYGVVLTAKALVASPGSVEPSIVLAALWDGVEWTRLPDTGQIGGWAWTWTGDRLVSPELGSGDGGEVRNWGRVVPFGGSISLPGGAWSPLDNTPEPQYQTWLDDALGERWSITSGYLYDDAERTWTTVDRPDGAPTGHARGVWADGQLYLMGGDDGSGFVDTVLRGTPVG